MKEKIKQSIALGLIYLCNLLPIKQNKIFMFSYYGSNYSCNPKYISNYIAEYAPDTFDLVWAFHEPDAKPDIAHVRKVKTMSLKYFYELCTAKVVITNYRTTDLFIKRKNQYYIQTWHSSLRLKQVEQDAEDVLPPSYLNMAKKDAAKCDLLLSGCTYSTAIFRRAFWYSGEIFEHGTPRNDVLFQNSFQKREQLLKRLDLAKNKKLVLYAPTFRANHNMAVYDLDYQQLSKVLQHKYGQEWVILVKLHPHLLAEAKRLRYGEQVVDVTSYDDIQELLLVADMLITDYSSLMFDFAITKRPCFLYIPDVKEYTKGERKLYFNLQQLPFIQATSNRDLFDKIAGYQADPYQRDVAEFLSSVGSYEDGRASERLVNRLAEVCSNKTRSERYETV